MAAQHPFDRNAMLDALVGNDEPFDLLVVGGGITGVGVALDAANRGLRVALVERDDLASGTSSKSSKLVHGGLRYLQNGDVRLVYEALHERRRLMQNAPHMVEVLPFLLPILTKDGVISKKIAKALGSALWMYDLTGGWRIGKRHRRLSASQAAAHFPTTHLDKLSGGYLYYDATADDARLTLTIAKTAAKRGAVIVTRCAVIEVTHGDDGHVSGAVVEAGSGRFVVAARAIVNATGVWADEVRALDEHTNPDTIRPAKGVHVTLPWSLVRNDIAVVIPVRRDKRSLFIVPWGDLGDGTFRHVYVGTTDTDFDDSMNEPSTTGDDIDYILEALNQSLDTNVNDTVTAEAITGVWAGLRPLVKSADDGAVDGSTVAASTKDLSRRHQVSRSDSGVVTVTGGKLTTYRQMAEDAVDEVVKSLPRSTTGRRLKRRSTRRLQLAGSRPPAAASASPVERHLVRRFGTQIDEVRALIAFDASLGEPLVPGLSYLRAEAVFAARCEMATTLDDVVMRRTRAHLEDRDATLRAAPDIVSLLQAELGWTDDAAARQLEHYRSICAAEEAASGHVTHPTH